MVVPLGAHHLCGGEPLGERLAGLVLPQPLQLALGLRAGREKRSGVVRGGVVQCGAARRLQGWLGACAARLPVESPSLRLAPALGHVWHRVVCTRAAAAPVRRRRLERRALRRQLRLHLRPARHGSARRHGSPQPQRVQAAPRLRKRAEQLRRAAAGGAGVAVDGDELVA